MNALTSLRNTPPRIGRRRRTALLAVLALAATPVAVAHAATSSIATARSSAPDRQTNSGQPAMRAATPVPVPVRDGLQALKQIMSPAGYPHGTKMVDLTTLSDFTPVTNQSGVTFSPTMEKRSVPNSWATWGSPPDTESATPNILYTVGSTSVTLTFADPVDVAGVEVEPNPFEVHNFIAVYQNGSGHDIGSISQSADGNAGARVLAAFAPGTKSVTISSDVDFSIGAIRYGAGDDSDFTTFSKPTTQYLKGMCLADLSGLAEYADVSRVDMPGEKCLVHSVSFSTPEGPNGVADSTTLEVRQVPGSWPSWGPSPYTESPTPRVLYTDGATSVVITFGVPGQWAGVN